MPQQQEQTIQAVQQELITNYEKCSDSEPAYTFQPELRGQGQYIVHKCREAGIASRYYYGEVQVFAKTKKDKFVEIIEESYDVHEEAPPLEQESQAVWMGGALLCVMLKNGDVTYVTDAHFPQVVETQFMGMIPITKHYKIFRTKYEMLTTLATLHNILI